MTHTLTVYGKDLRVVVQMKGLNAKQASEVRAHFQATVSQAILDAPHVGIMKEHQISEFTDDLKAPEPAPRLAKKPPEPKATPAAIKTRPDGTFTPVDRAGRPLKAKKGRKRG